MTTPIQSQQPRVPIPAVELKPIEPPSSSVVQSAVSAPGFGPVVFAHTAEAQSVRSTLYGVGQQIAGAIRGANDLGGKTSYTQVLSRLRSLEKAFGSNALSGAWLQGTLTHEEQWATGLDFGRSLRALSQAMAGAMDKLTPAQQTEIEAQFKSLRTAMADGVGALPSVRLPPPLATTNAQGMRLETNDVELLKFAASVPKELSPILQEILHANPGDPMNVLDILAAKDEPLVELKRLALMFGPGDKKELRANLSGDLGYRGATIEADAKALLDGFGVKATEPLFDMFATAREAFKRGATGAEGVDGNPMDQPGWIHTRLEMPHSLESLGVVQGALPADQQSAVNWPRLAKSVWLGTLGSDLFKKQGLQSVLTHNRDGAELMVPLLASRHLGDLDEPENHVVVSQGKRFAHDHQIMPADMMAMIANLEYGFGREDTASLRAKIADPFAAPSKNGELIFDDAEQALLREKGISGWAVPSAEGDIERLVGGLAVILGDAMQYGSSDAGYKYAVSLRGPDTNLHNPVISSRAFEQLHPDRMGELEAGGSVEDQRGGLESAFDGSHADCITTLKKGESVFGAHLANAAAQHLDQARERFAARIPEVTKFVDERIRAQTGDRPVHSWDTLVPKVPTGEKLAPEVEADVKLVKEAFAAAIDELFQVPPKPFELEGGAK